MLKSLNVQISNELGRMSKRLNDARRHLFIGAGGPARRNLEGLFTQLIIVARTW